MTFAIEKALVTDVPAVYELLKQLSAKGLLLPRSYLNLYEMLQTFSVARSEGQRPGEIAGVGALQVAWEDLAEVRSLAVPEEHRKNGLGRRITEALEDEARKLGIRRMFTLTYAPGFFQKMGYRVVSLDSLPQKIWAVCFNCVHYPNCREIALVKDF
ncbi:MAG: N-acetyltransferase [Deltaproteobacteria bacterium]|jgi:amino-acid N-acetyltransferase|nr:N-acetyltransferase [Deltaproteobacteria bacterium]